MIKTATWDKDQKPTDEMLREIREAAKKEIVFDEDSPEMTPAMEKAFRLVAKNRNTQKKNDGILKKIYLCFIMKAHKILKHLML